MVGDRDERRGSIGTLETNWMGAGGERMGRRGRKKIVAPAPAERTHGGQDSGTAYRITKLWSGWQGKTKSIKVRQ